MTVEELYKLLGNCRKDDIVVISADEEGNGFRELWSVNTREYNFDEGEIVLRKLTPQLEKDGYTEEDTGDGKPCVVLW